MQRTQPFTNQSLRYNRYEKTLVHRVNKVLENDDIEMAIDKLQGRMRQYYGHPFLCQQLAKLLIENDQLLKAGKYLCFQPKLSEEEKNIVAMYFRSFNDDKTVIIKDLIGEGTKSPRKLCNEAKIRIFQMMESIKKDKGYLPRFMWNWYYHFFAQFKHQIIIRKEIP